MPPLTAEQIAYIERRRRQAQYWPWMALPLTLVLGGLYLWLWVNVPLFLNPQALVDGVRSGSVDLTGLTMLAALGTLAFLGCGLLVLGIILLTSASLWNERRLIAYLDQAGLSATTPTVNEARQKAEGDEDEAP